MTIHPTFSLTHIYIYEPIQDLSKEWMCCNCVKPVYARIKGIATSIFAAIDLLFHIWSLMVKSGGCLLKFLGVKQIPADWQAQALSMHVHQIGRALAGVLCGSILGFFTPQKLSLIYGETFEDLALSIETIKENNANEEHLHLELKSSLTSAPTCELLTHLKKLNNDLSLTYYFKNAPCGFNQEVLQFLNSLALVFVSLDEDNKNPKNPINREIFLLEKRVWSLLTLQQKEWFVQEYQMKNSKEDRQIREHLAPLIYGSAVNNEKKLWVTPKEKVDQLNEDFEILPSCYADYFHVTNITKLSQILSDNRIDPAKDGAFLGVFLSTKPEFSFGDISLGFEGSLVERSSPLTNGFTLKDAYWAGLSESLSLKECCTCIIVKAAENTLLYKEVQKLVTDKQLEIPVMSYGSFKPIEEGLREIRGEAIIPQEWIGFNKVHDPVAFHHQKAVRVLGERIPQSVIKA